MRMLKLISRHMRRTQCSVTWRILWMRLSSCQQFLPQMLLMSSQRNVLEAHQSWRIATILVHHPQWMLYRMVKLFLRRQAQWKVYLLLFAISCVSCFHSVQLLLYSPCAYDLISNWTLLALWFICIHMKKLQTTIPRKLSLAPSMLKVD